MISAEANGPLDEACPGHRHCRLRASLFEVGEERDPRATANGHFLSIAKYVGRRARDLHAVAVQIAICLREMAILSASAAYLKGMCSYQQNQSPDRSCAHPWYLKVMNVAGEELELVARGAGVTAEVGLGEVDEYGAQGGEPEDGRGNRQRRCHSRTNSIVGLLIDRADSSKRCYRRRSPSPFYLAFRI